MKKVLAVVGPTAVGKSAMAVELAQKYDGRIISGDSIQVYRGFDIGSGKITKTEMQGVPHDLIDIMDPHEEYSCALFQSMARNIMDHTDQFCIICGGTGLYIKSCLYDYVFLPEEDAAVDPKLEALDHDALYALLLEKDPEQAKKIHPHNRRRVIRALTILEKSGKQMSAISREQSHQPVYDAYVLGLTMPRDLLYARINQRVETMFEMGLQKEVENLLQSGIAFSDPPMKGIGYREWQDYFLGNCSVEEVKEKIQRDSRQFAKRQYTWYRHQLKVHWVNVLDPVDRIRSIDEIDSWYR